MDTWTDTHLDTQTDADRHTDTYTDTQIDGHTDTYTDTQTCRHSHRHPCDTPAVTLELYTHTPCKDVPRCANTHINTYMHTDTDTQRHT